MAQYADPEGMSASPDVDSYRARPQFAVSITKLAMMSICTFGFYELYWTYKQWEAERDREREALSPVWRTIFAPLWAFSLFPRVQALATRHGISANWSAIGLAVGFLILQAVWRLPAPWNLLSLVSVLPLLVVQRTINRLNKAVAPKAPRNDQFSGSNVVIMVVGGGLVFFSILGSFQPPQ
jgi:hypothetical protein